MSDPVPRRPLRSALARHRALVASMAVVVAGFVAYGLATGSPLALPYAGTILAGALVAAAVEPDEGFTEVVLAGLVLWAVGHLAGGTVDIGEGRTLYNAVLPGGVHADNVVHFVGFGTAGLAWWEASGPWLLPGQGTR